MMRSIALLLWMLVMTGTVVQAAEAPPAAGDPLVEQRLKALSHELRCLVCQNQSLADSNADLAVDLRNQVREQIVAGKSDAEIRAWLTARYGDFVLYRPPLKATTVLLWAGPVLLLIAALAGLFLTLRRRRRDAVAPALSEVERAHAEALLSTGSDPESR